LRWPIIADPPYEQRSQNVIGGIPRNDGGKVTEKLIFKGIDTIRDKSAQLIHNSNKGWSIIFCTAEGVAPWRDSLEAIGAKYKRACAWVKPDAMPQMNGMCPANGLEMVLASWHGQGASKWNRGGKRGIYTHNTNSPDRKSGHPTEKPLPLMKELIGDFTKPNDLIIDPFMGSGTTGVACASMGRRFFGIEIEEKYFDIACKRIEEAYRQPDMFVEPPKKAEKINLDIFD
jgi:DNA modification methylase